MAIQKVNHHENHHKNHEDQNEKEYQRLRNTWKSILCKIQKNEQKETLVIPCEIFEIKLILGILWFEYRISS